MLGVSLDQRALCFAISGAQSREGTQEVLPVRELGDISLSVDSLASFPGYSCAEMLRHLIIGAGRTGSLLVPTLFD